MRVFQQSLIEVRLFEPLDSLTQCGDRASSDLGVDAVVEAFVEVTLDVLLVLHHLYVFIHLLVRGQDYSFAFFVELRSTSSTEDLLNIKHSNVFVGTSRRIVDFGSLDKDTVGGQIHSPGQGRR